MWRKDLNGPRQLRKSRRRRRQYLTVGVDMSGATGADFNFPAATASNPGPAAVTSRRVDRKKFRLTPRTRGRGDCVRGDFAVHRSDCHEASMVGSCASSLIWPVPNWVTATFASATPALDKITRSNATFPGDRPITPTRSAISFIFGAVCFLELLPGRSDGDHSTTKLLRTIATVSALAGMSKSARATAKSALEARSRARLSIAPVLAEPAWQSGRLRQKL